MLPKHTGVLLLLVALSLAACNLFTLFPAQKSKPTPEMITPTEAPLSLPADLYYLDDFQIWRFNRDDQSIEQITRESGRINSFDYSPASQRLVYIINNQLIITDKDGVDRQVLRTGPSMLKGYHDDFLLERLNDQQHITSAIRTPHWSQDGRQIAFVENGLKMIDLEANQVETLIENFTTYGRELVIEALHAWSPDGQSFLLSLYQYPLERLVDRDLTVFMAELGWISYPSANHAYNSGKLTFAWSPNASRHYYADSNFGGLSALIRCDSGENHCVSIGDERPAHTYYFYAHPFAINEEELMVFMGASKDPADQPEGFRLYQMTYQGYGIRELRSDTYLPESALWAHDGVLITLAQTAGAYPAGSVLWLPVEDQPAMLLSIKNPENMRWGNTSPK